MATIFRENTSEVVADLVDDNDDPIEGATVTGVLRDKDGATVTGADNIVFVEGDPGQYTGTLSASLDLPDCIYFLTITGDDSGSQIKTVITCNVKDRKS